MKDYLDGFIVVAAIMLVIFVGLAIGSAIQRKTQAQQFSVAPQPVENQQITLVESISGGMQRADYFIEHSATPAKAFTVNSDKIVVADNSPVFQVTYNSVDTYTKIHFAIIQDTKTGVEYVVMRSEEGGITVTPRFHQDTNVEKK